MMRFNKISVLLLFMVMLLGTMGLVEAATGDLWIRRGNPDGVQYRDVWRITSTGNLVPGNTTSFNVGAATLLPNAVYSNDVVAYHSHPKSMTITANTTLTVANVSNIRTGALSGNITLVLPSAVVAGVDAKYDYQDVGGNLDATHTVTVSSTSGNINGSATQAITTAYSGKVWVSDGTNWFAK